MLQPLQLQDVSARYPQEIAELQDFLAKTGLPLDAAETLSDMVARLRQDRAFRRDLISHLWVVIHLSGRQISYPDLLGVLTLASAGPHFAADAEEAEAHELLRFLMETRRSFDAVPAAVSDMVPPAVPASRRFQFARVDEQEPADRRRLAWMATAAACLLSALFLGLWWHGRPAAEHAAAPAQNVRQDAAPLNPKAKIEDGQLAGRSAPVAAAPRSSQRRPSKPSPMVALETPPTPLAKRIIPVHLGTSAVAPARTAGRSASPSPTPAGTATAAPRINPQPRRRSAATPVAPAAHPNLLAEDSAPEGSSYGNANASRGAYVRPTSLGTMAANVMYSPAPAYPAAASAAHVQGEVRVEAEVDREGNVASTRVISGPPLLRDAASDAVQRWRYRPYLYDGKPVAMNALVVMDFHLP